MRANRPAVLIVTLLMVLGVFAAAGAAASAQSYPNDATLTVNDPNPVCGQTVQVVGTGFLPNAPVTVSIAGQVVGTATSDADGNFTFPYTLPTPCVDGEQLIRATDGTNTLLVTISVSSTTQSTANSTNSSIPSNSSNSSNTQTNTAATGTLPRTGSSGTSMHLVQAGILLVATGGILLVATRKRRQTAHTGS
jgi:LPXTG-motif cell wall-anchored protein